MIADYQLDGADLSIGLDFYREDCQKDHAINLSNEEKIIQQEQTPPSK